MEKILVVEDDRIVGETLHHTFSSRGYGVDLVGDGDAAIRSFLAAPPSAVVLDLQLPGLSGEDVCRQIKNASPFIPTIILTARTDVADTVLLLEAGADDYMKKPFSPRELLARVERHLKRCKDLGAVELFSFSDVTINFKSMEVKKAGTTVLFKPQEFKLLKYFCLNPDRVVPRDELLNEVWGYEHFPTTRTVDNHVSHLRQKLENDPANPAHFKTIHAVGYLFTR